MAANLRVGQVRTAAAGWLTSVRPRRANLKADILAGLPGGISNVPDGMAASVLAGVNPVHGLYACFAGPIAGGLSTQHSTDGDRDNECVGPGGRFCA